MTVCWQSTAPRYYSDLDTYIWQPFRSPPPFTYAKIFLLQNENALRNPRVVLLFRHKSSLKSFRKKFHSSSEELSRDWLPMKDLMRAISALYDLAIADTLSFLRETSRDIHDLVRNLFYIQGSGLIRRVESTDLQKSSVPLKRESSPSSTCA